jgi:hypothetical protein
VHAALTRFDFRRENPMESYDKGPRMSVFPVWHQA